MLGSSQSAEDKEEGRLIVVCFSLIQFSVVRDTAGFAYRATSSRLTNNISCDRFRALFIELIARPTGSLPM